jgi:hypothetical protein
MGQDIRVLVQSRDLEAREVLDLRMLGMRRARQA